MTQRRAKMNPETKAKFGKTNTVIFRQFVNSAVDCSVCRNAQTQKAGKGHTLICTLGITVAAKDCPEFKDARKPRTLPPIMGEP